MIDKPDFVDFKMSMTVLNNPKTMLQKIWGCGVREKVCEVLCIYIYS